MTDPWNFPQCRLCAKTSYPSRSVAKSRARTIPGENIHSYPCPHGNGYHIGHIPAKVKSGAISPDDYALWKHSRAVAPSRRPPAIVRHLDELESRGVIDEIGPLLAGIVAQLRNRYGIGPAWNEALGMLPGDLIDQVTTPIDSWHGKTTTWQSASKAELMIRLRYDGWVYFTREPRSLNVGPRYNPS